jgi:hypothetical protein
VNVFGSLVIFKSGTTTITTGGSQQQIDMDNPLVDTLGIYVSGSYEIVIPAGCTHVTWFATARVGPNSAGGGTSDSVELKPLSNGANPSVPTTDACTLFANTAMVGAPGWTGNCQCNVPIPANPGDVWTLVGVNFTNNSLAFSEAFLGLNFLM